jgi:hypothetical protein
VADNVIQDTAGRVKLHSSSLGIEIWKETQITGHGPRLVLVTE